MSKDKRSRLLKKAREHALYHGSDLVHALGCLTCGMRSEVLVTLEAMGWTEEDFLSAYFEWLLGVKLDG